MSRKRRATASDEWLGGLELDIVLIGDEGDPFEASVRVWASADGLIMGMDVGPAEELAQQAANHLQRVIAHPKVPQAPRPKRILVRDRHLALRLKAAGISQQIRVGPTPLLDEIFSDLREHFATQFASPTEGELPSLTPEQEVVRDRVATAFGYLDELLLRRFRWSRFAMTAADWNRVVPAVMASAADRYGLPLVVLDRAQIEELVFVHMPGTVNL